MSQPLPVGTILKNRYRITQLVAGGGMAWVYRAEERRPDGSTHTWAIKELRAPEANPEDLAARQHLFEQEARILAQLQHRNLPHVAAFFEEKGRVYLVMAFIAGESLLRRLKKARSPLLETEVINWAIQVCDVLQYLHTREPPVIFRDMKPSNIMVTPQGLIKLIDFGIARIYKAGQARDTLAMGSENYAAPEQWGTSQTDGRADIYGLGATMYHLLANVPPTPAFLPELPLPLQQYNPALSAPLVAVIEKAMARDREQRYPTAADMQADLFNCQPHDPDLRRKHAVRPPAPPHPNPTSAGAGKTCPRCRTGNRPQARFCRHCRHAFVGPLPARLRILQPIAVTWEMPIRGSALLIGRRSEPEGLRPDLDLAFYDPHGYVSRQHATILRRQHHYEITDLHSDNGTYVNDMRLLPQQAHILRHGDRIRIGKIVLQFAMV